jgi:hypothetical protein
MTKITGTINSNQQQQTRDNFYNVFSSIEPWIVYVHDQLNLQF